MRVAFEEEQIFPYEIGFADAGFVIRGVLDAVSLRSPGRCPPRLLVVARKSGIAPFIPGDRLVGGRAQVRTYRILEPIFRLWRQANSPYCRKCW